jgi:hypothetical protein
LFESDRGGFEANDAAVNKQNKTSF